MKESESNIRLVCKDCTNELQQEFRKFFTPDDLNDGYAKISFQDGKKIEHMWVEIKSRSGRRFTGRLANDPFVVTNIEYNDLVTFEFNDIEDYLPIQ